MPNYSILSPYNSQHFVSTLRLGSFTEKDLDEAFDRIDTNKDGRISEEELQVLFQEFAETHALPKEEVVKMSEACMSLWNEDGTGFISKKEFKRHAIELGEKVHPVIYQLAGCIFIMCVPFGIIVPYEPYLVASLGITAAQFGMAQGAMFVTKFLVNIPIVDIVDRVGSKPMLVACTALLGVSVGCLSLVSSLEHLIACRAIGGVAVAGLFASIQANAVAVQTPLNRARSSAPFTQAMNAGIALGPAIGGLLSGYITMESAFAGVGCCFLLAALANSRIYTEIVPPKGSANANPLMLFGTAFSAWRDVLRASSIVRLLCGTQAMLFAAVAGTNMTLMPLLLVAEPLSFTASAIGALSATIATIGIVVLQPLAFFADRYGRRTALGVGSATMGLSMAAVPLVGTPALVSGALACSAVGQNLLAPAISALLMDTVSKVDPSKITQAMSLLRSCSDIGMVTGAATIGAIGTQFGFIAGYEASASLVLTMGLAAFLRLPPSPKRATVK